jgi:hypothetical protein
MRAFRLLAALLWVGVCSGQSPLPANPGARAGGHLGVSSGVLFMSSRAVPLFAQREDAGVLPVRTVVEAQPSPDAAWLHVWHLGRVYEADASAFRPEAELLKDLATYEADVRKRYQETATVYDRKVTRMRELNRAAQHSLAHDGEWVAVFPAPAPLEGDSARTTNAELVVKERNPGPGRAAMVQREIRKLSREVARLEQQLADVEREGQRIADVRGSLERRFSDYRTARNGP